MWTYDQKAIRVALLGLILILLGFLYPHTVYYDRVVDGKVIETFRGEAREPNLIPAMRDGTIYLDNSGRLLTVDASLPQHTIPVTPGGTVSLPSPGTG
ncbi:MAG: hypothetical protein N3A72_08285 [bacterium]|nr:hypothetical protein [bacterium]